jgi:hypothetical protein
VCEPGRPRTLVGSNGAQDSSEAVQGEGADGRVRVANVLEQHLPTPSPRGQSQVLGHRERERGKENNSDAAALRSCDRHRGSIAYAGRTLSAGRSAKVHRSTSASLVMNARTSPRTAQRASAASATSLPAAIAGAAAGIVAAEAVPGRAGKGRMAIEYCIWACTCPATTMRTTASLTLSFPAFLSLLFALCGCLRRTRANKEVTTVGPPLCISERCVSAGRSASIPASQPASYACMCGVGGQSVAWVRRARVGRERGHGPQ